MLDKTELASWNGNLGAAVYEYKDKLFEVWLMKNKNGEVGFFTANPGGSMIILQIARINKIDDDEESWLSGILDKLIEYNIYTCIINRDGLSYD